MQSYRETKSLLAFWVECPGSQFAEFVTSPLDITGFELDGLIFVPVYCYTQDKFDLIKNYKCTTKQRCPLNMLARLPLP